MKVLITISLRNLLRQKRRNLLLGAAIGFGMMILVLANSFSHGISDVLFNRILAYVSGHASVVFTQNGNIMRQVFHDGPRMRAAVKQVIPGASSVQEAIGIMARAIGNGKSDNVILVGMDLTAKSTPKELEQSKENFRMLEGAFEDVGRRDVENPVLVSQEKARYMNVKYNDILRVRFQDVHGQNQAARLTIVGIFKPANIFMSAPVFLELRDLKKIAGYGPYDIGQLMITFDNPKKNAVRYADSLHDALVPGLAYAAGVLASESHAVPGLALGFKTDSAALAAVSGALHLTLPAGKEQISKDDILISSRLAGALGIGPGGRCRFTHQAKHDSQFVEEMFTVSAVFEAGSGPLANVLLVNDRDFYPFFYNHWPMPAADSILASLPASSHPLFAILSREWLLLDRTRSTEEMAKKYREMTNLKTRATTVDVQSMYENASMVVKLEYALNLITLSAVMILFFIILIGVVNTLRMTIRERTREIGTIRAIGMQKNDVRNIFILETLFLTFFACTSGTFLSFAAMWLLKLITFSTQDNPLGMLLVNGHLHFVPSFFGTLFYFLLILAISAVTAYFPARRAANMEAAAALRHFE